MQNAGLEFGAVKFSTHNLPEQKRLPSWREEFGRNVLRVDIEPMTASPFHAEAKLRALPGLRTVHCFGSAARFERTPVMAAAGEASVGLVINFSKAAVASQRGREALLGSGDAVPLLAHEASFLTGTQHIGVLVPHAALASRLRSVDDAGMKLIPHSNEPLRLLTKYMKLVHGKSGPQAAELREAVVSHIHDLLGLVLSANHSADDQYASAVTDARLTIARGYVAAHFQEPELSVAAVAGDQGISPRYLQRLFEATGATLTEHVTEMRLQKALTLLTETRDSTSRISDIALQVGFSDVSHFNRLFRRRFGESPSGVRSGYRG